MSGPQNSSSGKRSQAFPRASELIAPLIAFAGWSGFAAFILWQARVGPPTIWADSKSYATVASQPLWSSAFWAGQRPPLVPLVMKVFGSSEAFVTMQAVIAVVAWGVLAWTVGRLGTPGWRRVAASWMILAFATSLPIMMWNRSVLSESLSLSLLVLVLAGFIWMAQAMSWPRLGATTLACLCLAAARDSEVWTVGFICICAGLAASVHIRVDRKAALRLGVFAGGLVLVVASTGWGSLSSQRTVSSIADVLYVRVFPFPSRVAWFAQHGMPQQEAVDGAARATHPLTPGSAKVVYISPDDRAFKPLERWISADGESTYVLWLVSHPAYVVTEPLLRPERAFNSAEGDLSFYAAPGQTDSPLTMVMWPAWPWILIMSGLAVLIGLWSKVWRSRPWRVVFVVTLIGILSLLIAWHGDSQEVPRHTIEGLMEVRLGVWVLLTIGILRFHRGECRRRSQC